MVVNEAQHSFMGTVIPPMRLAAPRLLPMKYSERSGRFDQLQPKIAQLRDGLFPLAKLPQVQQVRNCGFIGAVKMGGRERTRARCLQPREIQRPVNTADS